MRISRNISLNSYYKEIFQTELVERFRTHILYSIYFFSKIAPFLMWKNLVEPDTPQMTIRRTRCACWVTKATGTHSEYVIFIILHDKNGYFNAP